MHSRGRWEYIHGLVHQCARIFCYGASAILILCGLLELIESSGRGRLLMALDPVTGIPYRWLILLAGLVQVACGVFAFQKIKINAKLAAVSWIGLMFLTYRSVLNKINPGGFCPCLGSLINLFSIERATISAAAEWIARSLFSGGLLMLLGVWLFGGRTEPCPAKAPLRDAGSGAVAPDAALEKAERS